MPTSGANDWSHEVVGFGGTSWHADRNTQVETQAESSAHTIPKGGAPEKSERNAGMSISEGVQEKKQFLSFFK